MPTLMAEPLLWEALESFRSCDADTDDFLHDLFSDNDPPQQACRALATAGTGLTADDRGPFAAQNMQLLQSANAQGLCSDPQVCVAPSAVVQQGSSVYEWGQCPPAAAAAEAGIRSNSFESQQSFVAVDMSRTGDTVVAPSLFASAAQTPQQQQQLHFAACPNGMHLVSSAQLPAAPLFQQIAEVPCPGTRNSMQLSAKLSAPAAPSSFSALLAASADWVDGSTAAAAVPARLPSSFSVGGVLGSFAPATAAMLMPASTSAPAVGTTFSAGAAESTAMTPALAHQGLGVRKLSSVPGGISRAVSGDIQPSNIVKTLNASALALQRRGLKHLRKPKKILELEHETSKAAAANESLTAQVQTLQAEWQEASARLAELRQHLAALQASNAQLRSDNHAAREAINKAHQTLLLQQQQQHQHQQSDEL